MPPDAKPPTLGRATWLADPALNRLMDALMSEGGEARIVGGAVRNTLLGEPVQDIDIATTEPPERVIGFAERAGFGVHPVGLSHGTVLVAADGRSFEVTTLRVDVETYGRHARVAFTDDWEADAKRRDFTINALYCDRRGKVFDPVGGYADIVDHRVRFVGDAQARIREDYLRILRFFRFHARYGKGAPDIAGLTASVALQEGIEALSAERIRAELFKLLVAPGAAPTLAIMRDSGILSRVLPGGHHVEVVERMAEIDRLHHLDPDPLLRLAALYPRVAEEHERLRLSNAERARLKGIADAGAPSPGLRELERKIVLYHAGAQGFRDAVRLAWAGEGGDRRWLELFSLPDEWTPPVFPVSGGDLLETGMAPGPAVGESLRKLEDWWVASGFTADRAALLARLGR